VTTNEKTLLTVLGDPTRQAILDLLLEGPQPVGQLAALLPVSRPAVSQHLKVLKEVGLVVDHQEGTRRVYWVDPERLSIPGPRLPEMALLMAKLIHPEVFGEAGAADLGPLRAPHSRSQAVGRSDLLGFTLTSGHGRELQQAALP